LQFVHNSKGKRSEMSFFFPLIFGMSAVLMLVFGTRKTVESHYEAADSRPAYLGGVGASTGTDFERDYAKHRTEPSVVPHVEKHLIKNEPVSF